MNPFGEALIDSAFQAYGDGRSGEAEATLRLIAGGSGRDGYVVYFIGHLCYLRGALDDAEFFLTQALRIDPGNARACNDLGETLRALGRNEEAAPLLLRAIELMPSLAHAYGNLAATLVSLNRPEEALRWAQESLWRGTDKAVAHCDLGSVFGRLNRPREAIRQYQLALALQPDNLQARYFEALMRLSLGEMPAAWEGHEVRLALPSGITGRRRYSQPWWRGDSDLAGRIILLHAEQGFGDTIQFVRYAPMVAALGATVLLEVQRGLKRLVGGMAGVAQAFEYGDDLPDFDLQCSLMSLPLAFRTDLGSIPAQIPYLHAETNFPPRPRSRVMAGAGRPPTDFGDPTAARRGWPAFAGHDTGRNGRHIGLAWSGSAAHGSDRSRSIALERLSPLFDVPNTSFHVIQRDIRDSDHPLPSALHDHNAELNDFAETAALISQMDLVISVDTAPAHLAGALGVETWLLLAHSADWRWMRERTDSPWYPSMTLFRQPKRDDWDSVVDIIAHRLRQGVP